MLLTKEFCTAFYDILCILVTALCTILQTGCSLFYTAFSLIQRVQKEQKIRCSNSNILLAIIRVKRQ
jgi:hypothetical protein